MEAQMLLIVGLGNPGAKYAAHRHNVGFMVVDRFAQQHAAPAFRLRFSGAFGKLRVGDRELGLLKPGTFMNLSGRSVQAALYFFKLDPTALVVVHDELDLPFGTVRIKQGGGTAGHNGLASIVESCATQDFCRLRVGVKEPGRGGADYVLSDFSAAQSVELPDVLERASAALTDIALRGVQAAMNVHNQKPGSATR
jgi:peptidyl-tRNA hydrolase, PTH1 family